MATRRKVGGAGTSDPPAGDAPVSAAGDVAARRILIVDDNQDAADSLAALVQISGYEARVAGNGPEALHLAAEVPPDVVLLDIGLPGMDGYEVCRRLRAQGLARTPIIALTGYAQQDRERSDERSFDSYVVKPCPHPELLKLLDRVRADAGPRP